MDEGVELAEVIRQLRGDLELAMWGGEGKDLRFRLGPVELELELALVKATRPGLKAKLMVVDVEAGQERSTSTRHRVKVVLHPRLTADPEQEPWVSGRAIDGEE